MSVLCLKDGSTPLHNASYQGHVEIVGLLLDQGANIEAMHNVSVFDDDEDKIALAVV